MFKLLAFLFLLFTVSTGSTEPFSISQLPYSLKGEWKTCTLEYEAAAPVCKKSLVPNNIEKSFPQYNGLFFYQTEFHIDASLAGQSLAIYIETLRDSDELYINGHLIAKTGSIGSDFKKATLYPRAYYIPSSSINFDRPNSILIKVFNHARQGGMVKQAPIIDSARAIAGKLYKSNSFLLVYIGLLVLIGFIQIFYYVSQPKNKEYLYFAILCIAQSVYLWTFSIEALHSGIHLNSIFRVNIFLYAFLTISFAFFITEFFKHPRRKWFKLLLILVAISGIYTFFIPLDNIYFQVSFLNLLTIALFVPYYMVLFYRSFKSNTPYAKPLSIIVSIYIISVLFDIAIDLQWIPAIASGIAGLISPILLLLLFISIMLILIHKHWLYYRHATFDYLTGTLRREAFIERLSEDLQKLERNEQSILVALIDIDEFKPFNDNFNHATGDKVLKETVARIRETLREFDLIGRYGGDEFCIAAQVQDQSDAVNLLKRVHSAVTDKAFNLSLDLAQNISITLGAIVTDGKQDSTAVELIEAADRILIKGKINQKGKVHI